MNRQYLTIPLEVKSLDQRKIKGHGSVFGNVDLGGDVVVAGAFEASLAAHRKAGTMPQMFWMHDPSRVPGMWESMSEDDTGLAVEGVLAETELGNEMRTLAKMKAVRGLSIGYSATDVDYTRDGVRLLKEVDLYEVSLVSLAMNPLAEIESAKSRLSADGEYVPSEREVEHYFRQLGCSRAVSREVIFKFFDADRSGMLPGRRWDAGDVDQEEVGEALSALLGKYRVASIRT